MNVLTINGTEVPHVFVDTSLSFNKPEKNVNTFKVPGRSGDLVVDYGTFKNVVITYPCFLKRGFASSFTEVVGFLGSLKGYQRIECSNDTTHFRLGVPIIPSTPTVRLLNAQGHFDLAFNCKPQRFLISGEAAVIKNASGSINNPTDFPSRPLIRVYGNGTLTFADVSITIAGATTYTDIDCEAMECFEGSTSRNANVSFGGNDYPVLAPGSNSFTLGSGITQLRITPRWWEL